MQKIERWFKGTSVCTGVRSAPLDEGPFGDAELCLAMATQGQSELTALADIILRLFPERACRCNEYLWNRVVHFNNHPNTTRGDVDKIMHTYEMEKEDLHEKA